METDSHEKVLTQQQTAELLNHKNTRTLGYWRERHIGPPAYHNGKRIAYIESEVLEWLRKNRVH